MMDDSVRELPWRVCAALLLLAGGVGAVLGGAIGSELVGLLPYRHVLTQIGLVLLTGGAALVLAKLLRISLAAALALLWLMLLFVFAGPLPVLGAAWLTLAAWSLGQRVFPAGSASSRAPVSLILGLGLLAGGLGWILAFPVHRGWLYLIGLGILILLSRDHWPTVLQRRSPILAALKQPRPLAAFVAVMSLGLASTSLWLPNLMYDDLAYHLGLAAQLDRWGYYRMDAASQVWAMAPWAGSILHGLIWLLVGDAARAGLNLMWLLLTASLLWRIGGQLGLSETLRWWVLALHASLPLTLMLGAGLHMESPTIAISLALVSLILEQRERPTPGLLLACATLLGFLIAVKASNILLVGPIGVWILWRWGRQMPWRWVPPCAALALLLAGSSYWHGWILTGNPFLPLYNDIFQSPFYQLERFSDQRWQTGFGPMLPWALTFSTGAYFEGWAGAAGVVWIALIGLVPLALFDRQGRALALVAGAAILLALLMIQYLRYAHPALVLLLPALMVSLRHVPVRAANVLLSLVVIANLAFHGNAHWALRDGAVRERVVDGRAALEQRLVPELAMARWIEQQALDEARVLLIAPERPYHARFAGQAFSRVWYDPGLVGPAWAADRDTSGAQWQAFWETYGISHVLTVGEPDPAWARALDGAKVVHDVGAARLWALDTTPTVDLMEQRDLARRRLWPQWLQSR